ncbi:RNA polymerase sigma factor [Flavonifractor sp. An9]|uniref:RNA polymerase sigma factor n=1 Tax=Flavonifractor sp. An9 TaxID=1965664 RepID=UPI000B37ABEF|nr:sigma-70 family RNA polymerase sigma factor [Flavonifractor sp. An9]OUN10599.1 RNA polymerase subunit sigma-70 [Flavonifractor sp. An9]
MTAACRLRRPGLRAHILHALRLLFARKAEEEAVRQTANAQAARMLDAYGNSILRLAYSYLHNQSDAEEVLQDTLLQFLRTAPVLESPQHEKAWLLRVAANLSKNRLKYNRLRSADELRDTLAAEQREDLSFVWEAVKALPQHSRAAIHLFYHEGCSTAQIASILGRKESTIRSDLRRGRIQLKEILKEAYDFGPEI